MNLSIDSDTNNLKTIRIPGALHQKIQNLSIVKKKKLYEIVNISIIQLEKTLTDDEKALYHSLNCR